MMNNRKIQFLGKMPDPFLKSDGTRMTPEEWWQHRAQIRDFIVDMEFGGMPPSPEVVTVQKLNTRTRTELWYRITAGSKERQLSFYLELIVPPKNGNAEAPFSEGEKYPVVLTGDGCYRNVDADIIAEANRRGYILARFNRLEIAADVPDCRTGGIYDIYPENQDFTAISAWAWGYMVCMDVFEQLPFADETEVGITGHSRGGKTVMLASAVDERIKYTCPNNSGCHGTASYRTVVTDQGPNHQRSERLSDMLIAFPHWMGQKLTPYKDREQDIPYDMHYFGLLSAPRYYFQIEGMQDYWINPVANWQTIMAVKECHKYLGFEGHAAAWFRAGAHRHKLPEFTEFMEFMDCIRSGQPLHEHWEINPYPDVEKNFDW